MLPLLKRLFGKKYRVLQDPDTIIEEKWNADFASPHNARFISEQADTYHTNIDSHGLTLHIHRRHIYAWTVNNHYRYRDFILEASIHIPAPETMPVDNRAGTCSCGFLFRLINESTFYSFLVSDGNMFRLDSVLNGTPVPVLGWTEIPKSTTPFTESKDVIIIARGTVFTLIINGQWAAEFSDDSIQAAGNIAFAGQNWAERPEVSVRLSRLCIESRPYEVEAVDSRWNTLLPVPPESRLKLAQTLYAMGNYVPALIELKRIWKGTEPSCETLLLAGRISLAQRLHTEAEEFIRKVLAIDNTHPEALAELGGILYLENRFPELENLINDIPDELLADIPFLSNLHGHVLHWKGLSEQAAEAYHRAAVKAGDQGLFYVHEAREHESSGNTTAAVEAYLHAARLFLATNDYSELETLIEHICTLGSDDIRVASVAGKFWYGTGNTAKAASWLKKAAQTDNTDSAVWYLNALIHNEKGHTAKTIECLEKAISLESNYGLYHFRLAEVLHLSGKDCSKELALALQTDGDNGWVHNLAALKALSQMNLDEAEQHILRARELLPGELAILANHGEIYRLQGRLDEILPLFTADDESDALHAAANLLVEERRFEEAEDLYVRALRKKPFDQELLTDRAAACIELDYLNEADDLLGRALDQGPSVRVYSLISFLSLRKGEYTRAEVALQQGLADFPDNPDLLTALNTVYLSTNRIDKARNLSAGLREQGLITVADQLDLDILHMGSVSLSCIQCRRIWFVPKDAPPQGSLHLTAEPPDDLPAGTCPVCQVHFCIGCAKEKLGEDGRFRCLTCGTPLKLLDNNIKWLLNTWNESQIEDDIHQETI